MVSQLDLPPSSPTTSLGTQEQEEEEEEEAVIESSLASGPDLVSSSFSTLDPSPDPLSSSSERPRNCKNVLPSSFATAQQLPAPAPSSSASVASASTSHYLSSHQTAPAPEPLLVVPSRATTPHPADDHPFWVTKSPSPSPPPSPPAVLPVDESEVGDDTEAAVDAEDVGVEAEAPEEKKKRREKKKKDQKLKQLKKKEEAASSGALLVVESVGGESLVRQLHS